MWINDLYRGADEAHTTRKQTKLERQNHSAAGRQSSKPPGKKKENLSFVMPYDLRVAFPARGSRGVTAGVCFLREGAELPPNQAN